MCVCVCLGNWWTHELGSVVAQAHVGLCSGNWFAHDAEVSACVKASLHIAVISAWERVGCKPRPLQPTVDKPHGRGSCCITYHAASTARWQGGWRILCGQWLWAAAVRAGGLPGATQRHGVSCWRGSWAAWRVGGGGGHYGVQHCSDVFRRARGKGLLAQCTRAWTARPERSMRNPAPSDKACETRHIWGPQSKPPQGGRAFGDSDCWRLVFRVDTQHQHHALCTLWLPHVCHSRTRRHAASARAEVHREIRPAQVANTRPLSPGKPPQARWAAGRRGPCTPSTSSSL